MIRSDQRAGVFNKAPWGLRPPVWFARTIIIARGSGFARNAHYHHCGGVPVDKSGFSDSPRARWNKSV
jgi:hypothetical protein